MNWEEAKPHKGIAWIGGSPNGPFMLRVFETNRFISLISNQQNQPLKGGIDGVEPPFVKTAIGSNNPRNLKFNTYEEACEARNKVLEISKDKTAIESCSNYDLEEAASGWAIENYAESESPRENPQAQGIFSVYPTSTTMNWYNNGNKAVPVYAVHKSGPRDSQTKFLVYNNEWLWVWASYFTPIAQ